MSAKCLLMALLTLPVVALAAPVPPPKAGGPSKKEAVAATGQTVILGTWTWQIEGNKLTSGGDLFWEQVTATRRNLVPQGKAALAILQGKPFEKVGLADLRHAEYSNNKVSGAALRPGTILALRTRNGKLAKLKVVGYRELHDTSFPEAKHLTPAWIRFAQSKPNTKEYHLEVNWTLYKDIQTGK